MSRTIQEAQQRAVLDLIFNGRFDSIEEFDEELDMISEYYSDLDMRMAET